jgi:hypothetical protein
MSSTKLLLRAAQRLSAAWQTRCCSRHNEVTKLLNNLSGSLRPLYCTRRLLNKADSHGLVSTGSVLRQDLLRRTNDARDLLDQLSLLLEQPAAAVPSIATLFAELQQLQDMLMAVRK